MARLARTLLWLVFVLAAAPVGATPLRVMVFGDSLAWGWIPQADQKANYALSADTAQSLFGISATGPQFTFVIHLPLAAGEYRLDAALRAYSSFDNDTGYSATSFASFALTLPASVIAEPHPAMLLCAGLVATATAMRRRPRPLPLTTPLRTAAAA